MKRIEKFFEYVFIGIILIILTPIVLVMLILWFVIYGIPLLYSQIWAKIRHDPQLKFDVNAFSQPGWSEKRSVNSFIKTFNSVCESLAQFSGASISETVYKNFDTIPLTKKKNSWHVLITEKTLCYQKISVLLSLEFGMSGTLKDEGYVGLGNSDDENDDMFPPVKAKLDIGGIQNKISFRLFAPEDVWFLIGFIRGDGRLNPRTNQLWVYVKEYNVWIVRYDLKKNEYGLRREYRNIKAHRYSFDPK